MKRRLLNVALFLLLGAIINVAVTWALAVALDFADIQWVGGRRHTGNWQWQGYRWRLIGGYQFQSSWSRMDRLQQEYVNGAQIAQVIPDWSGIGLEPPHWLTLASESASETDVIDARGWPMLSMLNHTKSKYAQNPRFEKRLIAGIELPRWPRSRDVGPSTPRVIPTQLILPGFAINAVFYAAIVWLLSAALFALRRRLRLRRGVCPMCAYPIGTSDVCTECGHRLP